MAWDHPRAVNPLTAVSSAWMNSTDYAVEWEARSLKAFEDQPLEELAQAYDLVLMDSPFTGTAALSGLIAPAQQWTDAAYLEDQECHSVGASYASYTFMGNQWALAVDAACQVSACRPDLCLDTGLGTLPDSWDEVKKMAASLNGSGNGVAMPLNPNHAYCAFIAIGLGMAGPEFWPFGKCCDADAGIDSLDFLRDLAANLHPASREEDPIQISERMAESDGITYVPLMFGYSSYSRNGFRRKRLGFGNAPRGSSDARGSVLGGVGVALSLRSEHFEEAADLARMLAAPEVQSGIYVDSGGQPGHARAWESESANAQTGGFFEATRETIEQAFVRPRVPGHRLFQQLAGEAIHRFLWSQDRSAPDCMSEISRLHSQYLSGWGDLEQAGSLQRAAS